MYRSPFQANCLESKKNCIVIYSLYVEEIPFNIYTSRTYILLDYNLQKLLFQQKKLNILISNYCTNQILIQFPLSWKRLLIPIV